MFVLAGNGESAADLAPPCPGAEMSSSSITAAEEQALLNKGISKDKVDEFAAAFALFAVPVDGGHRITLESLRAMLAKFGQDYGEDDLKYMLRQFSSRAGDGSAGVDFDAFATSMHEKMADTRFNEAFGDAFDLFDSNKSGELSKVELMTGMQMLGETLTEAEVRAWLPRGPPRSRRLPHRVTPCRRTRCSRSPRRRTTSCAP